MNKLLLPLLALVLTALPALPSTAHAQWPEHSAFSGLPQPVGTPSDALAAFLFRMETLVDQAPPPVPTEGDRVAWLRDTFVPYHTALLERFTQVTEHPPEAASRAEEVVIDGVVARVTEILAERYDTASVVLALDGQPVLREQIDGLRRAAIQMWQTVARLTDRSPPGRAWAAYAAARIAHLERVVARPLGAPSYVVGHDAPQEREATPVATR